MTTAYDTPGAIEASLRDAITPIEQIIADAAQGRMYILVDHEDRENRRRSDHPGRICRRAGDQFHGPAHGRGLICLPMTAERIDRLGLPMMAVNNSSRMETAFTVSIEAREGGDHRHFRRRPGPDRGHRDQRTEHHGPSGHARTCLSAAGPGRWRAGPRRPYRSGGRHLAAGRAQPFGRDLRDHEGRWRNGPVARSGGVCPRPRPQDRHHFRSHRLSPQTRQSGARNPQPAGTVGTWRRMADAGSLPIRSPAPNISP